MLFSALALLTHYNVVFILVAWYLWWVVWALMRADRWRRLATLLICGMSMTVLVLPVTPIALRQIPGYENPNLAVPGMADYLSQNWQAYLGGYAFDSQLLFGAATPWLWATLAMMIGGLILAWRARQTVHLAFLLTWLVGGLALYYVAVIDRGAFNVRYSSFVTPALYALLGISLAGLGRLWKPLSIVGLLLILVGFAPAVQADLYNADAAREDIEGLTEWLRQNAGPNDLILVDQKYPFGFYYQRYAIDTALRPPAMNRLQRAISSSTSTPSISASTTGQATPSMFSGCNGTKATRIHAVQSSSCWTRKGNVQANSGFAAILSTGGTYRRPISSNWHRHSSR